MKSPQGLNEGRGARPGRREINDGPHRWREHLISAREEECRRPGRDPHDRLGATPAAARPGLDTAGAIPADALRHASAPAVTPRPAADGRHRTPVPETADDGTGPDRAGRGRAGTGPASVSRRAGEPGGSRVVPPRPDTARGTPVRAVLPWGSR
jgi:hypothetical protein